jgi:DNA-binding beta-propeller fold protein YncE
MERTHFLTLVLAFSNLVTACKGQADFGDDRLRLEKSISMPSVKGRIDHMDVNLRQGLVYMAALGNNSLEVIDIRIGKLTHSIKGLDEPQGVAYIPQHNEIFIANGGTGNCDFYNASSFEKVASIKLSSDADDVRYDSANAKIYVGYGNGGIAIIDANSHKKVGDITLPGHPEGFQLDASISRLYLNVPDANIIAVIDLNKQALFAEWKNDGHANFPMAIDTANHTIFIGYRHPAKVVALDGRTGRMLGSSPTVADTDDLYFDPGSKQIFVSGGGGYINVFKQDHKNLIQVSNILSRNGARTSLLIPQSRLFILASRARGDKDAELLVYKINP